jgi:hypothetical protein
MKRAGGRRLFRAAEDLDVVLGGEQAQGIARKWTADDDSTHDRLRIRPGQVPVLHLTLAYNVR